LNPLRRRGFGVFCFVGQAVFPTAVYQMATSDAYQNPQSLGAQGLAGF